VNSLEVVGCCYVGQILLAVAVAALAAAVLSWRWRR